MIEIARRWRVLAAGLAAGMAGVIGVAGQTASAEPLLPLPPAPGPATVTQPVTVAAAPAGLAGPVAPGVAAPGVPGAALPVAAPAAAPQLATPAIVPATSGTIADYFKSKGVKLEPQVSRNFTALSIVLPMPQGWSTVPDPNVPDAFAVIADRSSTDLYTPNAQVVVYKLIGNFDPAEAISHGYVDSLQQMAWQTTDMTMGDFNGFPSSFIEGSYRADSQTINTSRRHVIATVGPDRYLVSLSVNTGAATQGVSAAAEAADAIVSGFKVSAPGAPTAPGAPAAAPAAAPPPGLPAPAAAPAPAPAAGLPQLLGLHG
ncbi:LpqN/LpqT family lipoprotein [Mycolicibacterium brisbanense]|uniref:Proline rich secreted protein Mtc28 n=2 Tax=Mycolicibacterium brisbanense TaxID=146020 RepID=A0A100VYG3_9MYCO|nr:LpqN/LpqT family lipoprotein [Mycolicibacterium brisbanense]GAS88236.1 proline rich secreted protein Mtc28 [Mycolicibacterium brisbanense]